MDRSACYANLGKLLFGFCISMVSIHNLVAEKAKLLNGGRW